MQHALEHSTAARRALLALALLLAAACGSDPNPSAPNGGSARRLEMVTPAQPEIGLSHGQSAQIVMRYVDDADRPLAGQLITLTVVGDPRGASLSLSQTRTAEDGRATFGIRAGAADAQFSVEIAAAAAPPLTIHVEISKAGFGALSIRTYYTGARASQITHLEYSLYRATPCPKLAVRELPSALRERSEASLDAPALFTALPVDAAHSIVLRGFYREREQDPAPGILRATGCLELPQGTLTRDRVLDARLAADDLPPLFAAAYHLTSTIALDTKSEALHAMLLPWQDLTDCPLDPAQLILDCVIDALDNTDPLDCQIAAPGSTASALDRKRGTVQAGARQCRSATTLEGATSLEQQISQATQYPRLDTRDRLAAVTTTTQGVLAAIGVDSTLRISGLGDGFNVLLAHEIDGVTLGQPPLLQSFAASETGFPTRIASPLTGAINSAVNTLEIPEHAFHIGFSRLAQETVERAVLPAAGLPTSAAGTVALLLQSISARQGATERRGCEALKSILCTSIGALADCLGTACEDGIQRLAQTLELSAAAADPASGGDVFLQGAAPIVESPSTGEVTAVGSPQSPGIWLPRVSVKPGTIASRTAQFTSAPVNEK